MNDRLLGLAALALAAVATAGCDLFRKEKCEWYLEPDPANRNLVEPGWVSLCARNYVLGRQKCFIQAELAFAEANYRRPFKYSSMKLDPKTAMRKVVSVEFCGAAEAAADAPPSK